MIRLKQVLIRITPLFLTLVLVHLFWRQSYFLLSLLVAIVVVLILSGHSKKQEFYVTGVGIIWGTIMEIVSVKVTGFHVFVRPDFMGIPLWAAVGWGIGFLVSKRVIQVLTRSPLSDNQ